MEVRELVLQDNGMPNQEETIVHQETIPVPINSYNVGHDSRFMAKMFCKLVHLIVCKGFAYQDSWKRRGEIRGVISNIDRKDDRLNVAIEADNDRDKCDGAVDGGVYRLLYVFDFIRNKARTAFEDWFRVEVEDYLKRADRSIEKYNTSCLPSLEEDPSLRSGATVQETEPNYPLAR